MRFCNWFLASAVVASGLVAAPVPKKQGEEVFLVQESGVPKLMGMDGKVLDERKGTNASLSFDAKQIVSCERDPAAPAGTKSEGVIRDRAGEELHRFPLVYGTPGTSGVWFTWSPDGNRVLIGESNPDGQIFRYYDLTTKAAADVPAEGFVVHGWSPDSKKLVAGGNGRLALLPTDGKGEPEYLTAKEDKIGGEKLSPDGTKVLYRDAVKTKYKWAEYQLFVFDLKTKKRTRVTTADDGIPDRYCWSPDGRRVAYTWKQAFENPDEVTECDTNLITSNLDGSDAKTVATRTITGAKAALRYHFHLCDWR